MSANNKTIIAGMLGTRNSDSSTRKNVDEFPTRRAGQQPQAAQKSQKTIAPANQDHIR